MWLVLAITVPFFCLIGIITSIRWLTHNGRSSIHTTRHMVADELRLRADDHKGKVRQQLLDVAEALELDVPYNPVSAESDHPEGSFITDKLAGNGTIKDSSGAVIQPSLVSRDLRDVVASMDNINLLLFLGAFLIVVSAGIFVGYNFQTLSGFTKVAFLFLFTAAFYLTGLVLYLGSPKLRPAGTTFTGIGLVLMPFVGVAAYNFTAAHNQGSLVWLITSLVSFALYAVTLAATRQTYIAYLMGLPPCHYLNLRSRSSRCLSIGWAGQPQPPLSCSWS